LSVEREGSFLVKAVQLVQLGKPLRDAALALPGIGSADVLIRVAACGICHSDAHYRLGISLIPTLPVTLGHEVAGRIEAVGDGVNHLSPGDRVYVHYLVSCGACDFCLSGNEQFCAHAQMIGKDRDGGYAEFIKVPARNVFALPDEISFEHGAVMMCSSATALHALNKARLKPSESIAIFGFGGLGFSALQLARAFGARQAYVVDTNPCKLDMVRALGGVAIDATAADPVQQIKEQRDGRGVDVSVDFVGSAITMAQAVKCVGTLGRAALVALTRESLSVLPYPELINKEAVIVGISDHLATELPVLIQLARDGKLRFAKGTLRSVSLSATAINAALDGLERGIDHVRTVIIPQETN
jgi:D-arabinose 1-dehydrogenase-like Zn-dependent alcohol dehydrogenase